MEHRMCQQCNTNEIYGIRKTKKYCDQCLKINENSKRKEYKRKNRIIERWNKRRELDIHFKALNPIGKNLIPFNFDTVSSIKYTSYVQHFGKDWAVILKRYNKQNEVINHIKEEFIVWAKDTGQQDTKVFYAHLRTTKNSFKGIVSDDDLRVLVGAKKKRYSNDDYDAEFNRVIKMFNYIPSSSEFRENCRINLYSYAKKFNLKGEVYIQLLKHYDITEERIEHLINRQLLVKSKMAKEQLTGQFKISEEELITDFKTVFDSFIARYGIAPSVLDFDRFSKYGKNTITIRLNMRYLEIAELFGYEVDSSGSPFERVTLENISGILKSEYKPQATFSWLKGTTGKSLHCDGYFQDYDLIVEVDGRQHFEPVALFGGYENLVTTQERDNIKNTLIPQHNLKLIRIAYDEPYHDTDFLKLRLMEHNIIPLNHTVIADSSQYIKSAS